MSPDVSGLVDKKMLIIMSKLRFFVLHMPCLETL